MQHMTEEQFVAYYYGDRDAPPAAGEHLEACAACAGQYETIRRVLTLVRDAPIPERDAEYGTAVWNRLRWRLGSDRRRARRWQSVAVVAAMLAVAFLAGLLWRERDGRTVPGGPQSAAMAQGAPAGATDRLVFIIVGDHLEASERVLLEVANADPRSELTLAGGRSDELVAANRIYRQTASRRGDQRVAALLAELEPILIELSHAGATLEGKKLAEIQKRIESKELLFKVRVISAQAADHARPAVSGDTL